MNISLPAPLRDWVQKQVKDGNYGSSSEFVREMIRQVRQQQWRDAVETKLVAGLNSPSIPLDENVWERIRREGQKAHAAQQFSRFDDLLP